MTGEVIIQLPDHVSILSYDWRSHHSATHILSLYCHMTGEVIIQLPRYFLYTVIWQEKSSSSYPDTVSMLSYDRRSHHPATRILSLYCHMTGEVIIQLPDHVSILSYDEKSSSSYPDTVSILSYHWRSHHPATRTCLYTVNDFSIHMTV
jgi:hypothetical protein